MRAVVFKGPKHVSIEERPVPALVEAQDAIVKVKYTALCGRYAVHCSQSLPLGVPHRLPC
jgi:D-arabinose 1-dehydrogenase-like Zn-dependent alcohol dehydrogenase